MGARFHSFRQQIKQRRAAIGIFGMILVIVIILIIVEVKLYGTGFPGKTLWDWLQLVGVLAIPIVGAIIPIVFSKQQNDRLQHDILQGFIYTLSNMLLNENTNLRTATPEQKEAIQAQTRTALRRLSPQNQVALVEFLHDSGLINKNAPVIQVGSQDGSRGVQAASVQGAINLQNANFKQANLQEAALKSFNLSGANFSQADLSGADLHQANLKNAFMSNSNCEGANLSGADLSGSDLSGSDLSGANLSGAKVTEEQLAKAKTLKGATMPDGSIHP